MNALFASEAKRAFAAFCTATGDVQAAALTRHRQSIVLFFQPEA